MPEERVARLRAAVAAAAPRMVHSGAGHESESPDAIDVLVDGLLSRRPGQGIPAEK